MHNDITVNIDLGELRVTINAEGVSWNPDIADDICVRAVRAMETLIKLCKREEVLELIPRPTIAEWEDD